MPWSPYKQEYPQQTLWHQQYSKYSQQNPKHINHNSSACTLGAGSSSTAYLDGQQQLPKEVYRKLRQVDQQQSTLTVSRDCGSVASFSARILDRREYNIGKGANDTTIVQLVEIIKKPGQSLGLYLREGNGIDRFTGVFASRFGENSELERLGDIVRPGDEILNVNNVEVTGMSIDDVVLMLSIPRRLLLRIKREAFSSAMINSAESGCSSEHRPVVIFQKSLSEDHKNYQEGCPNGASSGSILLKPACTASTWLGKRVRQQHQQKMQQEAMKNQNVDTNITPGNLLEKLTLNSLVADISNKQRFPLSQQINFCNGNQTPAYGPEQGQNLLCHSIPNQFGVSIHPSSSVSLSHNFRPDNVGNNTVMELRRPLPSLSSTSQPARCRNGNSGAHSVVGIPLNNGYSIAKEEIIRPITSMSTTQHAQLYFKQRDHLHSVHPITNSGYINSPGLNSNFYKSNSLPRRRAQSSASVNTMPRCVKWRNNLIGDKITNDSKLSMMSNFTAFESNTQSNPFKSRPNQNLCMLSATGPNRYSYMNGMTLFGSEKGRTIADIFSAQEYKNWAGGGIETMSDVGGSTSGHRSRWFGTLCGNESMPMRSSSLPSKTVLKNAVYPLKPSQMSSLAMSASASGGLPDCSYYQENAALFEPTTLPQLPLLTSEERTNILDRLHVSPLMNRRVPLRTAGSGFDVDRLSIDSFFGILTVSVLEGKNLKVPDRMHSKQMYVVLEINDVHRARTGISVPEQNFKWNESFEIDVQNAIDAQFFVYAWHPRLRYKTNKNA